MSMRSSAYVRTCYICLMTDEEETTEEKWVHPCRCKGTTKWCHETCILRWIEEKQRDNAGADSFHCPVCHTTIIVVHPRMTLTEKLCELADRIATRIAPLGTVMIGLGSVYWAALGFGAATYVQIFGKEAAIRRWNEGDTLVILILLPCIPVGLMISRFVNWEEIFLDCWRRNYGHLPGVMRRLLPIDTETLRSSNAMQLAQVRTRRSYSRILCSAFLFPSGSVLCGRLFLQHLRTTRVRQAFFGALIYIALKGALAIYTKHAQWLQRARRVVQNFDAESEALRQRLSDSRRPGTRTHELPLRPVSATTYSAPSDHDSLPQGDFSQPDIVTILTDSEPIDSIPSPSSAESPEISQS